MMRFDTIFAFVWPLLVVSVCTESQAGFISDVDALRTKSVVSQKVRETIDFNSVVQHSEPRLSASLLPPVVPDNQHQEKWNPRTGKLADLWCWFHDCDGISNQGVFEGPGNGNPFGPSVANKQPEIDRRYLPVPIHNGNTNAGQKYRYKNQNSVEIVRATLLPLNSEILSTYNHHSSSIASQFHYNPYPDEFYTPPQVHQPHHSLFPFEDHVSSRPQYHKPQYPPQEYYPQQFPSHHFTPHGSSPHGPSPSNYPFHQPDLPHRPPPPYPLPEYTPTEHLFPHYPYPASFPHQHQFPVCPFPHDPKVPDLPTQASPDHTTPPSIPPTQSPPTYQPTPSPVPHIPGSSLTPKPEVSIAPLIPSENDSPPRIDLPDTQPPLQPTAPSIPSSSEPEISIPPLIPTANGGPISLEPPRRVDAPKSPPTSMSESPEGASGYDSESPIPPLIPTANDGSMPTTSPSAFGPPRIQPTSTSQIPEISTSDDSEASIPPLIPSANDGTTLSTLPTGFDLPGARPASRPQTPKFPSSLDSQTPIPPLIPITSDGRVPETSPPRVDLPVANPETQNFPSSPDDSNDVIPPLIPTDNDGSPIISPSPEAPSVIDFDVSIPQLIPTANDGTTSSTSSSMERFDPSEIQPTSTSQAPEFPSIQESDISIPPLIPTSSDGSPLPQIPDQPELQSTSTSTTPEDRDSLTTGRPLVPEPTSSRPSTIPQAIPDQTSTTDSSDSFPPLIPVGNDQSPPSSTQPDTEAPPIVEASTTQATVPTSPSIPTQSSPTDDSPIITSPQPTLSSSRPPPPPFFQPETYPSSTTLNPDSSGINDIRNRIPLSTATQPDRGTPMERPLLIQLEIPSDNALESVDPSLISKPSDLSSSSGTRNASSSEPPENTVRPLIPTQTTSLPMSSTPRRRPFFPGTFTSSDNSDIVIPPLIPTQARPPSSEPPLELTRDTVTPTTNKPTRAIPKTANNIPKQTNKFDDDSLSNPGGIGQIDIRAAFF